MSIPVSVTTSKPALPPGQDKADKVKDQDHANNKVKDSESPASAVAKAHASLNSSIVQTSLSVSIKAGNDPLSLLLQTAINGINEELEATLGKDAIQNAAASQDNSPEATATRIVSLSTAFYGAYLEKNGLDDNAESREQFVGVIRGGFEKGFKEAQDVLQGLKVLDQVSEGIDKTFALVQKGFDDFLAGPQAEPEPAPETTPDTP